MKMKSHGFQRGHKEMAGAYGMDKAYKPKIKGLKAGRKSAKKGKK